MRLPDFLIIGAMKSGTTSLYLDLGKHPAVYLPQDKEPHCLASDDVLTATGKAEYGRLFLKARASQICGEASTGYSKLPDFPGVSKRARVVLGEDLRILYLVREPVSRTLSHHYHEVRAGTIEYDVNVAVRTHPALIQYSLYAMQIRPWREEFGEDRVRIIPFESYVTDRRRVVAEIADFLGIGVGVDGADVVEVANAGHRAPAPRGALWRFSRGSFYRAWIRPWLSRSVRTRLRKAILPKPPPRPVPPSVDTVDYILDSVRDDAFALQRLMRSREPLWDLEAVRESFAGATPP